MYTYKYNNKSKGQARYLRNNMTRAEKTLWNIYLRKSAFKCLRQKPIEGFIVDFYCAKLKLVIELDGPVHDRMYVKKRDLWREKRLKKYKISIIRFKNDEVLQNISKVIGIIKTFEQRSDFPSQEPAL